MRLDTSSIPGHAWLLDGGNQAERRRAATTLVQTAVRADQRARVLVAIRRALGEQDAAVLRELVPLISIWLGADAQGRRRLRELVGHVDTQVAARARAALRR